MIVDTRKLDLNRELADEIIAEEAICTSISRLDAATNAAERLGFKVEIARSGIWYFASALSGPENTRSVRIYLRHGARAASAFESRVRCNRECIALTVDDAATALLCILIDPSLEIELQAAEVPPYESYQSPNPMHFWGEWTSEMWRMTDEHVGPTELREILAKR